MTDKNVCLTQFGSLLLTIKDVGNDKLIKGRSEAGRDFSTIYMVENNYKNKCRKILAHILIFIKTAKIIKNPR